MQSIKLLVVLCLITVLEIIFLTGCGTEAIEIIENKCSKCHNASIVYKKKRSYGEWEQLVFGMKARGLEITAEEEEELSLIDKIDKDELADLIAEATNNVMIKYQNKLEKIPDEPTLYEEVKKLIEKELELII